VTDAYATKWLVVPYRHTHTVAEAIKDKHKHCNLTLLTGSKPANIMTVKFKQATYSSN